MVSGEVNVPAAQAVLRGRDLCGALVGDRLCILPAEHDHGDDPALTDALRALVAEWEGKRYPVYHAANDLRNLLDTGRLPMGFGRFGQ